MVPIPSVLSRPGAEPLEHVGDRRAGAVGHVVEDRSVAALAATGTGPERLPPGLLEPSDLRELRTLDLSHQPIEALPPSVGDLAALEVLCCADARLADVPASLRTLPSLRFLNLADNRPERLPEAIAGLSRR